MNLIHQYKDGPSSGQLGIASILTLRGQWLEIELSIHVPVIISMLSIGILEKEFKYRQDRI
jgi:hypothetical protein